MALEHDHSMTIAEMAQALGVSTRSIERNLKTLQQEGRLRRVGPPKGGYWDVLHY